jgi:hypothetical protein
MRHGVLSKDQDLRISGLVSNATDRTSESVSLVEVFQVGVSITVVNGWHFLPR